MTDTTDQIAELEREIYEKKQQLAELYRQSDDEPVEDHELVGSDGEAVHLSEVFDGRDDLIVIHNMGKGCSYCTTWADGFQGVLDHLEDRARFVVVSPDDPETQREFAESRDWSFDMFSDQTGEFTEAMGYTTEDGYWPGFSAFRRDDEGDIYRTGDREFGPGDDFCSIWHFFDLLADGADGWQPKYQY